MTRYLRDHDWPLRAIMTPRRAAFCLISLVLFFGSVSVTLGQSALDGFDPNANGVVRVVVVQPDGKILIGGHFTTVAPNGGRPVARNYLARLNPDGTLDLGFNPDANEHIRSIAVQADGKILVGGAFTVIGGQARNYIARLDAVTGLADSFDPNASYLVHSIAIQRDGKILVGGDFFGIGGQMRHAIGRLDPTTGLADSFNPDASGSVTSIAVQADGKVLAGGNFQTIGGQSRPYLARLDAATGLADSFNANANSSIATIVVQRDGKILVGGWFFGGTPTPPPLRADHLVGDVPKTSSAGGGIGGQPRNGIARLDPVTGLADSFDPDSGGPVWSIALQPDGKILAAGEFFTIGGQQRSFIARLNSTTGLADSFNPRVSYFPFSIAVQSDGKIVLGGQFESFASSGGPAVIRHNIGRLEIDGTVDQTLNLNVVGDSIWAIAVQPDGKFLVGSDFTSIGGVMRNRIARLNPNGTVDLGFNPGTLIAGGPTLITLQTDGKILIGGFFINVNGLPRNGIARLDGTSGLPDSFYPNPGSNANVYAIVVQPDAKILVAGAFTSMGGASRRYIARLDPTTGAADSFNPDADTQLAAMALQHDGKILVGGSFSNIGGQSRRGLARLDPISGTADSWDPNPGQSTVYSILVQPDGKILVGGTFFSIGGQSRNGFARLDPDTGLADSLNPDVGSVQTMALQADGKILVAGFRFARIDPVTGLPDSFNPGPVAGGVVGLAIEPDGKILTGGWFYSIGGVRQRLFARLSNDTAALQSYSVTPESVTWRRSGASPQFNRVSFEYSTDNVIYTDLGVASAHGNDWSLTGVNLPIGENFYVRARGGYVGGSGSNSQGATGGVWNVLLTGAATPTPTPTGSVTPSPSPTPTIGPTPTAVPTASPTLSPECRLNADFEDVTTLETEGWIEINDSTHVGTTGWFQGNAAIFPAQSGTATSYVAADFRNGTRPGYFGALPLRPQLSQLAPSPSATPTPGPTPTPPDAISNWLLTPPLRLLNGSTLTFYTRTITESTFPDRLQVRMSTNGASVNVGANPMEVGDFNTLFLDLNETQSVGGYPTSWTQITVAITGVPEETIGRLALRYYVTDAGPQNPNANYIGIDALQFNGTVLCPTPTPAPTAATVTVLGNISTRLRVETGNNVLIGGFIVTGTQPKKVIVRAMGPSLGLSDALADPTLELRDSSGQLIRANNNWRSDQQAEIIATGIPPTNDAESAIVETLPANGSAYTAIVRGANGGTGVGLVEVYDLDQTVDSHLANISTRGLVQTGNDVMIAGVIVLGEGMERVLVRAIGPSLPVSGALSDPSLELRDGNGMLIRANNNWRTDQEAEINATGIPPPNDLESALVETLPANGAAYTAIVQGVNDSTGVALIEIYALTD